MSFFTNLFASYTASALVLAICLATTLSSSLVAEAHAQPQAPVKVDMDPASDAFADLAGLYLAAANSNERLNKSECARHLNQKNPLTLAQAISQIRARLRQPVLGEFEQFVSSGKFKADMEEFSEFMSKTIESVQRDGGEKAFACGFIAGTVMAKNRNVFQRWDRLR